jgi:hypothetical protein
MTAPRESDPERLARLTAELVAVRRRLLERPEDRVLLARERRLDGVVRGERLRRLLARLRCAHAAKWN